MNYCVAAGRWLGLLGALAAISISANAESILGGKLAGLEFGDDFVAARRAVDGSCRSLREVTIQPPNFPLARNEETHLLCEGFSAGPVRFGEVALTFADDRLVLVFVRGNASSLRNLVTEPLASWMQFDVSWSDLVVIETGSDQAWIMSQEAAHPNLFQWPNPYLDTSSRISYDNSAGRPESLKFGERLYELKPMFEQRCAFTELGQYEVWLLTQPEVQHQLDCYGIDFAGFPRKIEAVFGDGILQQAWILTGAGEESRVRDALEVAFGEATYVDERWEIFDHGRVMLRKDKPEILMLSDELAPLYRAEHIDNPR